MRNWKTYWSANPKPFMKVMEKSTAYFANKLLNAQLINKEDCLLDYGCGPGNLAGHFKGKIGAYCGVDISKIYVEQAMQKMGDDPTFQFFHLAENAPVAALQKTFEKHEGFNSIVVLSVVQYFNSHEEVYNLLATLKQLLKPNGTIIIADVLADEKGVWQDLWSNCVHSLANGYFISFVLFVLRLKFSQYNSVKQQFSLLHTNQETLTSICEKLSLTCKLLPKMTLQKSRNSFCVTQ